VITKNQAKVKEYIELKIKDN